MKSFTTLDLQYAHRFYGFKGEAQYLHGHTGILTLEVEDTVNMGVNMVFPCNEIKKTAWDVLQNFDHALILRAMQRNQENRLGCAAKLRPCADIEGRRPVASRDTGRL